ncbi:hypothetical protein Csa_006450 [Cucumis sativus]|nr:hypothetical protein Csa_006450 [Cucumis sativus]
MDQEAARTARESLDLAFHMSNVLDAGIDRHTLSVLIALCDMGVNPEALAAVVKELRREPPSSDTIIACLADFVKITELAHMYSIQICWNESEGVFYLNVPWMDPTSVQMAIERQGTCLLGDERLKAYKY